MSNVESCTNRFLALTTHNSLENVVERDMLVRDGVTGETTASLLEFTAGGITEASCVSAIGQPGQFLVAASEPGAAEFRLFRVTTNESGQITAVQATPSYISAKAQKIGAASADGERFFCCDIRKQPAPPRRGFPQAYLWPPLTTLLEMQLATGTTRWHTPKVAGLVQDLSLSNDGRFLCFSFSGADGRQIRVADTRSVDWAADAVTVMVEDSPQNMLLFPVISADGRAVYICRAYPSNGDQAIGHSEIIAAPIGVNVPPRVIAELPSGFIATAACRDRTNQWVLLAGNERIFLASLTGDELRPMQVDDYAVTSIAW